MNRQIPINISTGFANFLNDTLVVIVLYKTALTNSITYTQLTEALSFYNFTKKVSLYVYDNSPELANKVVFETNIWEINYIINIDNAGLSVAYNQACIFAKSNQKKYLFLTDQDSFFANDIFKKYYQAVSRNLNIFLFAPIIQLTLKTPFSPCKVVLKRGFPVVVNFGQKSLRKYVPVNSGIFIYTEAFLKVGGYNDKVRLDFSDFQFIERYKKIYDLFYVIDSLVIQNFSNTENDVFKLLQRYKFYCEGAKNSNKSNLLDNVSYFIIVMARAISLAKRTKNLIFLKYAIKYYIL